MRRIMTLIAIGACANALAGLPTSAQAPEITLTRLDCGTPAAPTAVNQRFSDTYAYGDLKLQFIYSCYLIKHGDEYLLWDTGHAMTTPNVALSLLKINVMAWCDRGLQLSSSTLIAMV
jgi:N-acyl homoserine lactone hydrolase